jgi:hypothetical protein
MKIGDRIRIVKLPDGLVDDDHFRTRTLFELCFGRTFPIAGIQPVPEIGSDLLELEVGEVVGDPAYMHSIRIEREFVELVEAYKAAKGKK